MSFNEEKSTTLETLNDLSKALSEGERTTYDHIIRTMELPKSVFEGFCSWSEDSYTRNCIVDTEAFELILLCWGPGQRTPIHDHGGEECWVRIVDGEFRETIYQENESGELNMVKSAISKSNDITYMIDFMGFHRLENLSNKRSMSLHLYAKPIRNCKILDENTKEFVSKDMTYDTVSEFVTN